MSVERVYKLYFLIIIHIVTIVFDMSFLLYVIKRAKKDLVTKYFICLQCSVIFWVFTKMIKAVSPTVELRWISVLMQYTAVFGVAYFFLVFSYVFFKRRDISKKTKYLLMIYPISMYIILVTNPLHNLFFKEFTIEYLRFGKLYYLHTLLGYVYLISGFINFFRSSLKYKNINKTLSIVLFAAPIIPFIVNMIYVTNIYRPFFDWTPIFYALSNMIYGYAIIKFEFLSVPHIVVRNILDNYKNGIVLKDCAGNIVYENEASKQKLDKRFLETYSKEVNERLELYNYVNVEKYISELERLLVNTEKLMQQNTVLLEEIEKRRQLVLSKEKLKLARNIHDDIGHTYTSVIHSLEMARTKDDLESVIDMMIAQKQKLRLKNKVIVKDIEFLVNEIKSQAESVINLKLNVTKELCYDEDFIEALIYIVKESVTNAIKHGKATSIDIDLTPKIVSICDNGTPSGSISEGFGLKGIRGRMDELGYQTFFRANKNGFLTQIKIS